MELPLDAAVLAVTERFCASVPDIDQPWAAVSDMVRGSLKATSMVRRPVASADDTAGAMPSEAGVAA